MRDCSKHKKDIAGITDMKLIAEMIGDLHYGCLSELLMNLKIKLNNDGERDIAAGREQLGNCLINAAQDVLFAADEILEAWGISQTFYETN